MQRLPRILCTYLGATRPTGLGTRVYAALATLGSMGVTVYLLIPFKVLASIRVYMLLDFSRLPSARSTQTYHLCRGLVERALKQSVLISPRIVHDRSFQGSWNHDELLSSRPLVVIFIRTTVYWTHR